MFTNATCNDISIRMAYPFFFYYLCFQYTVVPCRVTTEQMKFLLFCGVASTKYIRDTMVSHMLPNGANSYYIVKIWIQFNFLVSLVNTAYQKFTWYQPNFLASIRIIRRTQTEHGTQCIGHSALQVCYIAAAEARDRRVEAARELISEESRRVP